MTIDDLIARMAIGDFIQTAAVLVAVVASIVALFTSWRDRANARRIATEDRRASLEQAKLILDLELLARLLENFNRGGSSDSHESSRMGAEALTLIGMLGPDHLPTLWKERVENEDARLADLVTDPEHPEWKREAIQVQLAVNAASARVRALIDRS